MTAPQTPAAAASTPADYFTRMYAHRPDPWQLADRWYEQRKYALTLAVLPKRHYHSAFEPGCSVGVLSALLATRCRALLSCDREETALAQARRRLAHLPHVTLQHRVLPDDWPPGRFDLVVLSELLYYFTAAESARLLDLAVQSLQPAGTLLLVHWRPEVAEHAQSGDAVHHQARAHPGLVRLTEHTEPDFLLDVFVRAVQPAAPHRLSVAAAEGLR